MTSQIRSHIEYLIQTYNILLLILYLKLMRNIAAVAVLIRLWWFLIVAYFFGPPCIAVIYIHSWNKTLVDLVTILLGRVNLLWRLSQSMLSWRTLLS